MQTLWFVIKLVFWSITLGAFLYSFLTHFMLWVNLRLSILKKEEPAPLPWQALIKSFFIEFFCVWMTCWLYPFRSWSPLTKMPLTENPDFPILLVHGYLHHQNSWLWFIQQLRKKKGIGPIYSINLLSPFLSIAKLAEQIQHKVNEIQAETNTKQIILIGHSMGGLVNSYFCEYLAKPNQVAKVITLGTPFKGTKTAVLAYGENAEEMVPQSFFLNKLLDKIQQSKVPYFSIASKVDNIIIPWHSALIYDESSPQIIVLKDYGHLRLLISPSVIEQVTKWITP